MADVELNLKADIQRPPDPVPEPSVTIPLSDYKKLVWQAEDLRQEKVRLHEIIALSYGLDPHYNYCDWERLNGMALMRRDLVVELKAKVERLESRQKKLEAALETCRKAYVTTVDALTVPKGEGGDL